MEAFERESIRTSLEDRRRRLEDALAVAGPERGLQALLQEVDSALGRLSGGGYGICETCHEAIEDELLLADPLVRFCMPHLSGPELQALQADLELAARIQSGLLPKAELEAGGWTTARLYHPLGAVSGDYCDLAPTSGGSLFFAMGDVAGKGIAASMLMAHLQAMVRVLLDAATPLDQLLERVSRIFCETTLPAHFATIVCGLAHPSGEVELVNAGHVPPLVARRDEVVELAATGLPIGLFCQARFGVSKLSLGPGEALVLYTDGLTEARDPSDEEYGRERLRELLGRSAGLPPKELLAVLIRDLGAFRRGTPLSDDLSVLVLRRAP